MNRITIIGNLGQDPQVHTFPSGSSVTNFSVAVNKKWKDAQGQAKESTTWFNVAAWAGLGETCARFLAKGRQVCVEGEVIVEDFTDRQGVARREYKINAQNVHFLGSASDAPQGGGGNYGGGQQQGGYGQQGGYDAPRGIPASAYGQQVKGFGDRQQQPPAAQPAQQPQQYAQQAPQASQGQGYQQQAPAPYAGNQGQQGGYQQQAPPPPAPQQQQYPPQGGYRQQPPQSPYGQPGQGSAAVDEYLPPF